MTEPPLLPEDEAKLRAERYVWDRLENRRDDMMAIHNRLDETLADLDARFEQQRKDLYQQQQADRQGLADRSPGKGQAEIDRLFAEQAEIHVRQTEAVWINYAGAYEDLIKSVAQIGQDRVRGHDREQEGRGR
jgi:small-conductance mechanosensitive channel